MQLRENRAIKAICGSDDDSALLLPPHINPNSPKLLAWSNAIDLKPFGGLHMAYVGRSTVLLNMGSFTGALADSREALRLAPDYVEGYIRRGDAFMAMEQLNEAEADYSMALQKDPSIRRSKALKARVYTLNKKLVSTYVH